MAWTGHVCEALLPVVGTLRTPPSIDVTDPAAAQRAYSSYLQQAMDQAQQAQQQVDQLDAPPVDGGAQLADQVRDQVGDLREDVRQAQQQVADADPANPLSVGQAVAAAGNVLGALGNNAQAVGAIADQPELRAALEQAPACDQLRAAGVPS
jgi:hypothetical protein